MYQKAPLCIPTDVPDRGVGACLLRRPLELSEGTEARPPLQLVRHGRSQH